MKSTARNKVHYDRKQLQSIKAEHFFNPEKKRGNCEIIEKDKGNPKSKHRLKTYKVTGYDIS